MQTIPQIIADVAAMSPRTGMSLTNGAMERACTTGVIDRIAVEGSEVVLTYQESEHYGRQRYVAIYVRVSTEKQADGFSLDDQAERAIRYCVTKRRAFRIFTDTQSGGLPPDIPHLVAKMQRKRAQRYSKIFTNIFLSDYVTRYSEAQKTALRAYLRERTEMIRTGQAHDGADDTEIAAGQFRPGVTCLIRALEEIDEVVVTDMSRLARSAAITEELAERFTLAHVKLTGLIEPIHDLDDLGPRVMAIQAEQFLASLTANSIRGTLALLESGRAPSMNNIPWWCARDGDGRAVPHPVRWGVARQMIDRFLGGEGPYEIWCWLRESGTPAPSKGSKPSARGWDVTQVTRTFLDAPSLRGTLNYYGLEWAVLPPLVTDDEWWQIRQMRSESTRPKRGSKDTTARYLATGLFRCLCGDRIYHHAISTQVQPNQYTCSALRHRRSPAQRGQRHVTVKTEVIDSWLDDVMRSHPISLLQNYMGGKGYSPLSESIRSLAERLERIRHERQDTERAARQEAVSVFSGAGLTAANPGFDGLVLQMVAAKTHDLRATERRLEADLRAERQRQEKAHTATDWAGLAAQAARWDALDAVQRNAILQALFVEFRWCRNEATAEEWIVPVLRGDDAIEIEPIQVRATGRKTITRTLETAEEWLERAVGVEQYVRVLAPDELGQRAMIAPLHAADFCAGDGDDNRKIVKIGGVTAEEVDEFDPSANYIAIQRVEPS